VSALEPARPRDRIVVLDTLRGIALLGVLIGNAFHLYSGLFATGLREHVPGRLDKYSAWFVDVVVQSKAQTLLTFLFGLGFAMQLVRAEERGERVTGLYVRRMLALLAFGLLHVALLWWGDVLWTYAVAGLWLLAFQRASNRTRVIVAVVLCFVPSIILSLPGVYERAYELLYPADSWPVYTQRLYAAMRGDDHLALLWEQIRFAPVFSAGGFLAYHPWLVGRFLLGYVAGALHWFDRDGADHLPLFRRMLVLGAIVGIAGASATLMSIFGVFGRGERTTGMAAALAVLREANYLGLAAMYMAAVVLLFQRRLWRRVLAVFAPVGRMPLTVYLTQSLIMTGLLYGWGLGWLEVLTPAAYLGLSLAVFAFQIIACHLWLRVFQYGPLEWLWRGLVYLKLPPMRVAS
jgi:uncharacterized protein